jgi:hypothetical protein
MVSLKNITFHPPPSFKPATDVNPNTGSSILEQKLPQHILATYIALPSWKRRSPAVVCDRVQGWVAEPMVSALLSFGPEPFSVG